MSPRSHGPNKYMMNFITLSQNICSNVDGTAELRSIDDNTKEKVMILQDKNIQSLKKNFSFFS